MLEVSPSAILGIFSVSATVLSSPSLEPKVKIIDGEGGTRALSVLST